MPISASGTTLRLKQQPFEERIAANPADSSMLRLALKTLLHVIAQGKRSPVFVHPYQRQTSLWHRGQSLVRDFFSGGDRGILWQQIRIEHERIWFGCETFSEWELLCAMQTLLTYCLLRITYGKQTNLDLPLLVSVKEVASRLAVMNGNQQFLETPVSSEVMYERFILNEARKRTMTLLRVVALLVDVSDAVSCQPAPGFKIIPLPCDEMLWGANMQGALSIVIEPVVHGLGERGGLFRLTATGMGVKTEEEVWESWCAERGEFGLLLAIAAQTLQSNELVG